MNVFILDDNIIIDTLDVISVKARFGKYKIPNQNESYSFIEDIDILMFFGGS